MEQHEPYEHPRPLTEREREILDFLLSVDLPGIKELREQAKTARAVRWGPRDPSFAVYVDQEAARPSSFRRRSAEPQITADTRETDGPQTMYQLKLWVNKDGWLSHVKFTPFGWGDEVWLEELLPPSEFDPPEPYERIRISRRSLRSSTPASRRSHSSQPAPACGPRSYSHSSAATSTVRRTSSPSSACTRKND